MNKNYSIAALITVHNRKIKTLKCLENLFNQKAPENYQLTIYLVDDGCTDGTSEAVSLAFPSVKILKGTGNLFWNRGMHLAWQTATQEYDYDFYLWLNDDTQVYANALKKLLGTSNQYNNKSIIVGTTCSNDNKSNVTYGGRNKKGKLIFPKASPQNCDYFNGNIVLIPRYVYQNIGTNDPIFHHALGDWDYGLRAKHTGIQSIIAPNILGECDTHDSLGTWCNPKKNFKERWKAFRSPVGQNPEEFFIFEKRHRGSFKAIFHYFTNYLRVTFPSLWKQKIK